MVGGRERGQLPLNFLGPNLGKILLLQPSSQQTKLVIDQFPGLDHPILVQKPSPAMTLPPGKAQRGAPAADGWVHIHKATISQPINQPDLIHWTE